MSDEVAKCRGCGLELEGKPYYMGGRAYHPVTKKQCLTNAYGGFVCSETCDLRAARELEGTMPGCYGDYDMFPMIYQNKARFYEKWENY